jgi:hypothetical protein
MGYFWEKCCRWNKLTFCVQWLPQNRAVCEIMWNNIVQLGRSQLITWRMRIACWIPKATNTHSEYVILIAFPLQQWMHERALILRYTMVTFLFILSACDSKEQFISLDAREIKIPVFEQKLCTIPEQTFIKLLLIKFANTLYSVHLRLLFCLIIIYERNNSFYVQGTGKVFCIDGKFVWAHKPDVVGIRLFILVTRTRWRETSSSISPSSAVVHAYQAFLC